MQKPGSRRFGGFCLVSPGSDFTRLAACISEQGIDIYGIGRTTTPESFRQASTRFILTENFVSDEAPEKAEKRSLRPMKEAVGLINRVMQEVEEDGEGWCQLGTVGTRQSNLSSEFDTRTYGHPRLPSLVAATGRFDIDRSGPQLRIRPKR